MYILIILLCITILFLDKKEGFFKRIGSSVRKALEQALERGRRAAQEAFERSRRAAQAAQQALERARRAAQETFYRTRYVQE